MGSGQLSITLFLVQFYLCTCQLQAISTLKKIANRCLVKTLCNDMSVALCYSSKN